MTLVSSDGNIEIGSFQFPDRKCPSLCVKKGSVINIYGSFHNTEQAEEFMRQLAELVGVGEIKEE